MPRPTTPLPLTSAITRALADRHLAFGSLTRNTRTKLTVLFSSKAATYWMVTASVDVQPDWTPDDLDDALYDATIEQLAAWAHDQRS